MERLRYAGLDRPGTRTSEGDSAPTTEDASRTQRLRQLLYLPNKPRELLERALRVPALSEGWKESFRELLAKPVDEAPAWAGFRPLRVAEIRRESATISSFRLVPAGDAPSSPKASAGQYLTVRVWPDADAPPLIRSYSLSDLPDERGYRISVRRSGPGSRYLHDHLKVGDALDVAAPRGSFVPRDGTRPVVLLSAGVGATPVLAILHALVGERSRRPVWWVHGARDRDEHAFAAEVDALLAALPDAHRLVAHSRPNGTGYDVTGRLDLAAIEQAGVPRDADYYLCGPDGFMRTMGAALTARGVEPGRVAAEIFGAVAVHASGLLKAGERAPHPPDGPAGTGPTVTFARSNLAIRWDDRYANLLDLAEACDVPVGFGCRNGTCHNCGSGLLAGTITYSPDPLEPPPDGRVLVCCNRPTSELALDL